MAKTSITLTHERASDYRGGSTDPARLVVSKFSNLLAGCVAGTYPGATGFTVDTGPASGTVTLGSSADDVTVTVGGFTTASVPAGASDTLTAVAVAEEINDTVGMSSLVVATADGPVITLTSKVNGAAGNFGLDAEATSAGSATSSGVALTGGVTTTYTF